MGAATTKFRSSDWINICCVNMRVQHFKNAITVWFAVSINGILSTYYFYSLMCMLCCLALANAIESSRHRVGKWEKKVKHIDQTKQNQTEPNQTNSISFD